MTGAILFTLLFFPVYLWIRNPFRRLPLHVDTGFYVSNHTVATGRFDFSKGWNAHYAGCSKVVPELFYSFVYVIHSRRRRGHAIDGYKPLSRLYASLFNYLTTVAVGVLASALAGGEPGYYCVGLVVFALLSSEPHWGVYFECGELFEPIADVVSVMLLLDGVRRGDASVVGLSAFVWIMGSFFIKLSSAMAFFVLFGGIVIVYPWTLPSVLLGSGLAAVFYILWLGWNRRNPWTLLRALQGHEASYGQWADWRGWAYRLIEKSRTFVGVIRRQPLLPALAVSGVLVGAPSSSIFWLYTAAVAVTYVGQSTDCRYYLIPLLPAIALLGVNGAMAATAIGPLGWMLLAGVGGGWLIHNRLRAGRLNDTELNRWCWEGGRPAYEADRNLVLERSADHLRRLCGGESLLVYGPLNQAYVLLGVSYVTPSVAPEYYMDHVQSGWQRAHNLRLTSSPPKCILDTSACFDAQEARAKLGLDYRLTHVLEGDLRFFRLSDVSPSIPGMEEARTYAPQSRARLRAEERLAGGGLVTVSNHRDANGRTGDPAARALADLLQDLATQGHRRLAIYGAGRFTLRHAELYRASPVPVGVVLDDNAVLSGATCLDWPVRSPNDVDVEDFDAIIVSTDRFAAPILANVRRRFGGRVRAFTITT